MKKSEKILLYIFIILIITNNMLQNSLYFRIPQLIGLGIDAISYVYFAILIIKYLKIKKWKLIITFLIIISACYTGYVTNNLTLLSSVMFLIITAITNYKEIIKLSNRTIGIVLFIHILIYLLQMFLGNVSVSPDWSGRTRYLLGFISPNTSGIYILWWVIGKVYLSNYNIKRVLTYTVIIIIIFYLNRCRSMLYSAIILLILTFCINKNIGTKIIKFLAKNIILIMTFAIIISINLYNIEFKPILNIDKLFSNRIFFSTQAINDNGYTILGQQVKHSIVRIDNYVGEIVMDVTYTALLYRYGIVYLILLVLLSKYITKNYSENEYSLLIIYGVFAMLELYSLNFIICFPMLFGAIWIGEKNDT